LADPTSPTDNVWGVDCSRFFRAKLMVRQFTAAYFVNDGTINLMRHVLRGRDRGVLDTLGHTKGGAWRGG